MSECFNNSSAQDQMIEKFHQLYDACSHEQRTAILWLLENLELVDRITSISVLPEDKLNNLLQQEDIKQDSILKMILLYQKFKQEQPPSE